MTRGIGGRCLFGAANIRLIHLDRFGKTFAVRFDHGTSQLVQPSPCRLVTAQAEYVPKAECAWHRASGSLEVKVGTASHKWEGVMAQLLETWLTSANFRLGRPSPETDGDLPTMHSVARTERRGVIGESTTWGRTRWNRLGAALRQHVTSSVDGTYLWRERCRCR